MKTNWMKGSLALALSVLLGACAALSGLKAPEVNVADINFAGGNFFEQRFRLKLRVHNPNDRDIAIDGLSFTLDTGDRQFARGYSSTPTVLPRLGETLIEVEGTAQALSALRDLPGLLGSSGRLPYRLRGEVLTRDYGRIPFDRRGDTSLGR